MKLSIPEAQMRGATSGALRLRFVFQIKSGATPASGVDAYWNGDIWWITPEDLGDLIGKTITSTRRAITEEGYKSCAAEFASRNSLVLSKRAPIGQAAILGVDATCNQGCFLLTAKTDLDERFFYYCLVHLRPELESLGRGSTFMELSTDALKSVRLPTPSIKRQKVVADFLDRETEHIDSLISDKLKMLELLNEKNDAFFTKIVMRGVNARARFKQTGLDWLREIPSTWELQRGKRLFSEIDERSETGEETLLSLRMQRGLVPHNDVSEKPIPAENLIGYKIARPGEIVLNRMRAASGLVAVTPQHGIVSPDYAVFRALDGVDPKYFTLLFKTPLMQAVFRSLSKGLGTGQSGFLRLYSEDFLAIKMPAPSLEEQKAIVKEVARIKDRTTALQKSLERSVNLLKERRAALITAAVTGQLAPEEMSA